MPIEPVKIPQNVYIEDRIVGPLTLKQIIVMTLGAGFSYIIFTMIQKTLGAVTIPLTIMAWTPAAIAAAFALIKVNDLSLMRICFLLLEKSTKTPVRTWAVRQGISINIRVNSRSLKEEVTEKQIQEKQKEERRHTRIQQLSTLMDQPLDTLEEHPAEAISAVAASPVQAQETVAPTSPARETEGEESPATALPVNPARLKVDGQPLQSEPAAPQLSNLEVFRDVFPPQQQ